MRETDYPRIETVGDTTVVQGLARGWGMASSCKLCDHKARLPPAQLLERLWRHLDEPLATALKRARCGGCGAKLIVLHPYNAGASALPCKPPQTCDQLDHVAAQEQAIREWGNARAGAERVDEQSAVAASYRSAKAR